MRRYRVRLGVRRRRKLVSGRPRRRGRSTRSDEHGPPSGTRRPGTGGRPHSAPGGPRALPVAQTAADGEVVLTDRVAEVVMDGADVSRAAVAVARARRERPARLEAGAERIVVRRASALAVRTAVATLDRRIADAPVRTDLVPTAVRVRETLLVLRAQTIPEKKLQWHSVELRSSYLRHRSNKLL